jgi:hypothetical protein
MRYAPLFFLVTLVLTSTGGCATTIQTARHSSPRTPNYNWKTCTEKEANALATTSTGRQYILFCDSLTGEFMAGCPIDGKSGATQINHCAASHLKAACGFGGCWPLPIDISGFPPFADAQNLR